MFSLLLQQDSGISMASSAEIRRFLLQTVVEASRSCTKHAKTIKVLALIAVTTDGKLHKIYMEESLKVPPKAPLLPPEIEVDKDEEKKVVKDELISFLAKRCTAGVEYASRLCIEGLVGVAVDDNEFVFVHISETVTTAARSIQGHMEKTSSALLGSPAGIAGASRRKRSPQNFNEEEIVTPIAKVRKMSGQMNAEETMVDYMVSVVPWLQIGPAFYGIPAVLSNLSVGDVYNVCPSKLRRQFPLDVQTCL